MIRFIGRLVAATVLAMSVSSTAMSAGRLTIKIPKVSTMTEIGKQGSCQSSGYVSSSPGPITPYVGKTRLLSSQLIGTASVAEVTNAQQKLYAPFAGIGFLPGGATLPTFTPPADSSKLYRITYASDDQTLSGFVVVPDNSIANGLVVYTHATQVSQQKGAPSNPSNEACTVTSILAGKGRLLAMPDYIGFGVNSGNHPYPLGTINAQSGIDIIIAAKEFAAIVNTANAVGTSLAITGYSEGGGNAFWLARKIATANPPLDLMGSQLTMIAPMSGPYDMMGAMVPSMLTAQPGVLTRPSLNQAVTYLIRPLLVAFAAQGASDYAPSPGSSLSTLLKSPFLDFVQSSPLPFQTGSLAYLRGIVRSATATGYTLASPNPANLMQPDFVTALNANDSSFPAVALWQSNDNIDWVPEVGSMPVPTYVAGILQDEIVPFAGSSYPLPEGYTGGSPMFAKGNSENLIRSLRAIGSSENVAWVGLDAKTISVKGIGKLRLNHLIGFPAVFTVAAKAIETGSIAGLPTIPDPN